METIIAAVCQAVSQAATPDQRTQAGGALLMPVLQQLRDALAALGPPPQQLPGGPGGTQPPAPLAATNPHLNPLVDRLAEVFGRTADSDVVAQMLSKWRRALHVEILETSEKYAGVSGQRRDLNPGVKG